MNAAKGPEGPLDDTKAKFEQRVVDVMEQLPEEDQQRFMREMHGVRSDASAGTGISTPGYAPRPPPGSNADGFDDSEGRRGADDPWLSKAAFPKEPLVLSTSSLTAVIIRHHDDVSKVVDRVHPFRL